MVVVEFKKVQGRMGSAAKFLQSRIEGNLKLKGSQIQIEEASSKDVKHLLHKFLHENRMDEYRVLSQAGTLEVLPPREEKHTRPSETPRPGGSLSPYSPFRTSLSSYVYPNYPAPPSRKYKRTKQ